MSIFEAIDKENLDLVNKLINNGSELNEIC
jgi:hypothetical protein